jgi:thymidylate synthase (FAD)
MDSHAQKEIREFANAIYALVEPLVPITMKAFTDFRVNAMHLSGPEIESLKTGTVIKSPGERREFLEKLKRLGLEDKN